MRPYRSSLWQRIKEKFMEHKEIEIIDTVTLSRDAYTHLIEDIERARANAETQHKLATRYADRAGMLNDLLLSLSHELQEYKNFFIGHSAEAKKFEEWKGSR